MCNKKRILTRLTPFLCSAALLLIPSISCAAGKMSVGTGFDYSSGDYGEDSNTDILYIPFNCKYQNDSFALGITVPYIRIKSEGNVIGGGSNVVVLPSGEQQTQNQSKTESGLGDIVASATYFLYEGVEGKPLIPAIDLTGKIKLPTADEDKGLGTGETDYSVESDFTWFSGQTAWFGTIGYKFLGSPAAYDLNNVMYGTVGMARQLTDKYSGGIMYDVREASTDSGSGVSEATLYGTYKVKDDIKLLVYGVKGFSDGSPDYGIGCTLTYSMNPEEIDWLAPVRRITNL